MLKMIIAGIKENQEYAASNSALVNPPSRKTGEPKISQITDGMAVAGTDQVLRDVEFDVAVTSTEGSAAKAGVGIFVAGLGLGMQGELDASSSSISRVEFSIPLAFPLQTQQG